MKKPIQWEDGYIIPPTEPGLGIELNEEMINKHRYQGDDTSLSVHDDLEYVRKVLRAIN
jgi:2-dehydro-3-deoxyphosphogalactonate aldolase